MIIFTDFVQSKQTQYMVGFSVIFFTGLNILVNITMLLSNLLTILYLRFKAKFHACLYRQKMKRKEIRKNQLEQLKLELMQAPRPTKKIFKDEEDCKLEDIPY